jgi:DNA (cytosine-5)-methyltransferase 1
MLRLIDLFSGAGGLTLGFTKLSGCDFVSVWANDIDKDAVATYNKNFGLHCIFGDIEALLENPHRDIPQADIVIGGLPCQGFSLLNKDRENDARRQMWRPFMDVVERSNALVFVIENVPQILDSPEFEEIVARAKSLGFTLSYKKLCAADYGVPQLRWRAFILGCRFADPSSVFPPKATHCDPKLYGLIEALEGTQKWRTVRDAIADLPFPEGTEITERDPPLDLHFKRIPTELSIRRYKAIPNEGMNRFDLQRVAPEITPACWIKKTSGGTDLFGRLWWDRPSVTIRTEFFKPEKGRYLHPEQHRPITHREAARLQSFPDDFRFIGNKASIARQIGNAVPPLLAASVAKSVYALFGEQSVQSLSCFCTQPLVYLYQSHLI